MPVKIYREKDRRVAGRVARRVAGRVVAAQRGAACSGGARAARRALVAERPLLTLKFSEACKTVVYVCVFTDLC